tara:strand:+ start:379 stop:1272 length:894 start_codon:yes stop_codon:yes gene_type:complete
MNKTSNNTSPYKNTFDSVICQLIENKKRKKIKVCDGCHEIGHNRNSVDCKLNIEKDNKLKNKIQQQILSKDSLSGETLEEHLDKLSITLNISIYKCKTLYERIPPEDLLDRTNDVKTFVEKIKQNTKLNCKECNKIIYNIHKNTNRKWKGNIICDSCWITPEKNTERDSTWKNIHKRKKVQCIICGNIQNKNGERYHYDHLNMFDKENSLCIMVNEGNTLEEIYIEVDKCQILCLCCHHIVTDIENKMGFTRIKQSLTRKLNNSEITEEEYIQEQVKYGKKYINKMNEIYSTLKSCI